MSRIYPFSVNGKVGYRDSNRKVIVEPTFDVGADFRSDIAWDAPFARVGLNGLYGMIDTTGHIVVSIIYDDVVWLGDSFFRVRKGNRFGVVLLGGNELVPIKYFAILHSDVFFQCRTKELQLKKNILPRTAIETNKKRDDSIIYIENEPHVSDVWYNHDGVVIYRGEVVEAVHSNVIIEKDGQTGVINSCGDLVVRCRFSEIHCPRRDQFIVRRNEFPGWKMGVIDAFGAVQIPFKYEFIRSENGVFYECFESGKSEMSYYLDGLNSRYRYMPVGRGGWLTANGIDMMLDHAFVLSDRFLAFKRNNLIGIFNSDGKKIVNPLYDNIGVIDDCLVVDRDKHIGLLGPQGDIIINPIYKSIEFTRILEDEDYSINSGINDNGSFGPLHMFFSEPVSFLNSKQRVPSFSNSKIPSFDGTLECFGCSLDRTLVLHSLSFSELFTKAEGLIPNSRFDRIEQMTSIHFAVQNNNKWGVFDMHEQKLIIPCAYDKIAYNAGHVVYVCVGDLWGAFSLPFESTKTDFEEVKIPPTYYSISSIDPGQSLFSVQREKEHWSSMEYTIVNSVGEEIYQMRHNSWDIYGLPFEIFTEPFAYYRMDRIKCGSGKKFGFISIDSRIGYVSVPIKYTTLRRRYDSRTGFEDGYFDVCIKRIYEDDNAVGCNHIVEEWGVLDIEGREIVAIKYAAPIPIPFNHSIVKDAISERCGVLDEDGSELIPSIYDRIEERDGLFLYGIYRKSRIGSDREDWINWGCFDVNGRKICSAKYDLIVKNSDYIIAGRDGGFGINSSEYSGVYDVYDSGGLLLFGGIRFMKICDSPRYYKLFVGGHWDYSGYEDENYNYIESQEFNSRNGGWLLLDEHFNSIVKTANKETYVFPQGQLFDFEREHIALDAPGDPPFPSELLLKREPIVSGDYVIIRDRDSSKVLHIGDSEFSNSFSFISHLYENYFFLLTEDGYVSLAQYNSEVLLYGYSLFSYPENGWFWGIKINEHGSNYDLDLLHIKDSSVEKYRAATGKGFGEIYRHLSKFGLGDLCHEEGAGIKAFTVFRPRWGKDNFFDSAFLSDISPSSCSAPFHDLESEKFFYPEGIREKEAEMYDFFTRRIGYPGSWELK